MKKIKCELFLGTRTGSFMKWGTFDSISECKKYINSCIDCYYEIHRIIEQPKKEISNNER